MNKKELLKMMSDDLSEIGDAFDMCVLTMKQISNLETKYYKLWKKE